MANWGEILTDVTDHLNRSDLSTTVSTGIVHKHAFRALRYIEQVRDWHWLDKITVSASTNNQRIQLPSDFIYPISVTVNENNSRDGLKKIPPYVGRIEYKSDTEAKPNAYALLDDEIQFYPKPDKAYTYDIFYKKKFAEPTQNSDTNYVTTNMSECLVYKTCSSLSLAYLQDPNQAQSFELQYQNCVRGYEDDDDRRRGSDDLGGMVEPDSFYSAQRMYY